MGHLFLNELFRFLPKLRRFGTLSLQRFGRNQNITGLEIDFSFLIYIY